MIKGSKHTLESCRLMSENRRGKRRSQDVRRKMSEAMREAMAKPETRQRLRESHLGKKHSEETRRRIGEASRTWASKPRQGRLKSLKPEQRKVYDKLRRYYREVALAEAMRA